MGGQRVAIPGSEVKHGGDAPWSPAPCDAPAGVTIYIRPQENVSSAALLSGQFQPVSREEAEAKFSASARDMQAVRAFVEEHGLRVTSENPTTRTIQAEGTAQQMESAFGVSLCMVEGASGRCLSYEGSIMLPANLGCVIVAVLGLDQRPIARRHVQANQGQ